MKQVESAPKRMIQVEPTEVSKATGFLRAALLAVLAVAAFQVAFAIPALAWLVLVYLGCLFALRQVATTRQAFYLGLLVGLGVFVPQTMFLWKIFGSAALPLWLILAFFHGVFLFLLQRVETRWGTGWAAALAPVMWCGLEYFRSEIWWLRFSWFSAASPLANSISEPARALFAVFGIYGSGFVLLALTTQLLWPGRWGYLTQRVRLVTTLFVAVGFTLMAPHIRRAQEDGASHEIKVAGVQLEFPGAPEVLVALDRLAEVHPEAELLMLCEYTFDGPVPDIVREWCRRHGKWLVAGGKEPLAGQESYFNTAFVIGTNGEIVFSQAKARPIQFFRDGEPATEQKVWQSPWGPLGILVCYDASYRQVTDELIRQGAQALLIPAMDVEQWGEYQHRLNSRVTGLRAAEYGLPIFRVASSGISQIISPDGRELASAPFPGPGAVISGVLKCRSSSRTRPLDTWLAPVCLVGTLGVIGVLVWPFRRTRFVDPRMSTLSPTALLF
ncbi:MAG TPA: nitrilase-related carbon-nitrogen hydrolase [Verrucomicrobiota bacterium]|nr:hypothetical protein [Verrucomicrobiales bacterium]HRI16084.1 nitrilase-related carbon-nitrogen hydrolase [Verrucomicrobiota bacterium]